MRALSALAAVVLFVAACTTAPPSADQTAAAFCQSYATTLKALSVVKTKLSADEVAVVDEARGVINPVCETPDVVLDELTLTGVRDALQKLYIIQNARNAE